MAFDVTKPADTQTIALGPQDIRENFRALKEDKIVAAATAETSADAQAHIGDATDAHMGSAIGITATSYGHGLATTDTTLQKVADRVNQNGTPQFVTDASKCSLLLDFKNGLSDKTRGIVPVNYNSANKWSDNFVNDSTSKEVATNISCTFKSFEGDEGKFGSGIAVEESRTNLLTYSDDLTNAAWTKTNCTVTLDRMLPDGRKLFKVTVIANGNMIISQTITTSATAYTASLFLINNTGKTFQFDDTYIELIQTSAVYNNLTRINGTKVVNSGTRGINLLLLSATAGDTFYITSPQLESGTFPTSYIATGATAVTRPAGNMNFDPKLININSNYAVSFWAKPHHNYNSVGEFALLRINTSEDYKYGIYFEGSTGKYTFEAGTASIVQSTAYNSNVDLQKHHHFTMTKDGTAYHFFIDGVWKKSLYNVKTGTPTIFSIGSSNGVWISDSTISNLAIFNYALSADEVSNIYNAGLEGKPIICVNSLETAAVDRLTTVINATHAMTADSAITATTSDSATNANHATTSDSATNADTLDNLHASAFALVGHTTHTGEAASLAQNGYKKFADGTIIQWGQAAWLANESSKAILFPIAFPTEPKSITVLPYTTSTTYTPSKISAAHGSNYFTAYRDTSDAPINFYWIAIGY